MNIFLVSGISIVNLALVCYSIFFFLKKKEILERRHITFLALGILFDITSTVLMIIGSSKGFITVHGILGYTALLGMCVEFVMALSLFKNKRRLTAGNIIVTRITYFWWILVYVAGLVLVMGR